MQLSVLTLLFLSYLSDQFVGIQLIFFYFIQMQDSVLFAELKKIMKDQSQILISAPSCRSPSTDFIHPWNDLQICNNLHPLRLSTNLNLDDSYHSQIAPSNILREKQALNKLNLPKQKRNKPSQYSQNKEIKPCENERQRLTSFSPHLKEMIDQSVVESIYIPEEVDLQRIQKQIGMLEARVHHKIKQIKSQYREIRQKKGLNTPLSAPSILHQIRKHQVNGIYNEKYIPMKAILNCNGRSIRTMSLVRNQVVKAVRKEANLRQ